MSCSEWKAVLASLQRAYPNPEVLPEDIRGWGDEGYWNDFGMAEGQMLHEAQAESAIGLYDDMQRVGMEIPAPLRAYIGFARQVVAAWQKYDELDEGDDEEAKEKIRADRLRQQLAKQAATRGGAKVSAGGNAFERGKQWQQQKQAAQAPAPVPQAATPRQVLRRFWLPDLVFVMRLSPYEFLVYAFLARRAGKTGVCWPGRQDMTAGTGLNRKTVSAAVDALTQAGMLAVRRGSFGRSSRYTLTHAESWKVPPAESVTDPSSGSVMVAAL